MKLLIAVACCATLAGCGHLGRVRDLPNPLVIENCPDISADPVPTDMGNLSLAYIARNQQYNLCRAAGLKSVK